MHLPRRPSSVAIAVLVAVLALTLAPPAARAQDTGDTTTPTSPAVRGDSGINDIVPQPNSGVAPQHPSDPGGWEQYLVFALIIGGMAAIVLLVVRESHLARARASSD